MVDTEQERAENAHEDRVRFFLAASEFRYNLPKGHLEAPTIAQREECSRDVRDYIEEIEAGESIATNAADLLGQALQFALDYHALSTPQFVAKYGRGATTRDVGDVARYALAKAKEVA